MIKTPLISVVIPTYNRLPYLKEAVDSVVQQTLCEWELLIIDDGSTDDTFHWLKEIESDQIRVFKQAENQERSAARNLGLWKSKGALIMFLDDDDILRPTALEKLSRPILEDPDLVAAVGARWKFLKDKYTVKIPHPESSIKRNIWPDLLFGWSSVSGQNLYRKSVVQKVGGYLSTLIPCEDRQLWLKVAYQGKVSLVPDIVLEYRAHENQWRPDNIKDVRESVYQEFIANTLSADGVSFAQQIRQSAHYFDRADMSYKNKQTFAAIKDQLFGIMCAHVLAFSPLVGQPMWRDLLKYSVRSVVNKK